MEDELVAWHHPKHFQMDHHPNFGDQYLARFYYRDKVLRQYQMQSFSEIKGYNRFGPFRDHGFMESDEF